MILKGGVSCHKSGDETNRSVNACQKLDLLFGEEAMVGAGTWLGTAIRVS